MGYFKKALLGAAFGVVASASFVPAQAVPTITSPSALNLLNLGTDGGTGYQAALTAATISAPSLGITSITYSGSTTGIYSGTSGTTNNVNGYTSPFGTSSNRDYFAVEPGGSITFGYGTAQTSFALLIGTVDSYNNISFTTTGASGSQTFSGTDIMNALGGSATGSVTENVLFSGLNSFTTVTLTDNTFSAFEFNPGSVVTAVPEPASMALLGAGLVGVGVFRRRRAK